jgi:hypothetical protein
MHFTLEQFEKQEQHRLTERDRSNFHAMQRKVTEWMNETFTHYVCNWQEFGLLRVFENFCCTTKTKQVILVTIVYNVHTDEYYTYQHQTDFK